MRLSVCRNPAVAAASINDRSTILIEDNAVR